MFVLRVALRAPGALVLTKVPVDTAIEQEVLDTMK